ncbi:hypothetical protein ASG47_19725 [Devosia sp. Leaf420]|uniref:phage tail tube protein n=1 Tax=Devosia sp. Leaf420 TaxID=1736374 RepID=UPI00071414BE|nr:phage tail tube protein [Devosia sp. Leaf420]KQT50335.1 hypothetical protein ASG47_19725 [Devosia sp. Leaf420]
MAKARASGADAVHLIAKETTYGTPPDGSAGGVYRRMPLRSMTLGKDQPLEDDPTWNRGIADDGDPSLGAATVAGDLVAPMDVRGIGFLLTMVLGAPTTVADGGGRYTHTWKSGKELFSYAAQVGHPKLSTPKWRTHSGIKAGGIQFPMARNGRALVTVPLIAQQEIKDTGGTPQRDASPLIYPYLPFDNALGSIKVGGSQLGSVTAGQCNFLNNLEAVDEIRPDMAIAGVDEQNRSGNGSATVRFGSDSTLDDLADNKLPAALEFAFSLASQPTWGLKYQFPRTFWPTTKKPIDGPGGIAATLNWRAAYDSVAGYLLGVVLINDVPSY